MSENHTIADSTISAADFETIDDDFDNIPNSNLLIDDEDLNDTTSTTNNINKLLDALSLASTMITEKRSMKREQSLRTLFKAITQYTTSNITSQEIILTKLDDVILPFCKNGLKSGVAKPAEQYASCRVLEATSIVIGADQDEYIHSIFDLLIQIVKGTGRAIQVRGAALRALSMSCFICASDFGVTDKVLDLCELVSGVHFRGEDVNPILRAVGLDCWGLLCTTIDCVHIAGDDVGNDDDDDDDDDDDGDERGSRGVKMLPLLNECLNHANLDLRCSAGECLALIHEARLEIGLDDDEVENTTHRKFSHGSWEGSDMEELMDVIKDRVAELSVESGHHMSKKAKKEQKATFREFMATIVEDESPDEVVAFRGGTLNLHSWKEIVQLNFIRHCLQSGFQVQLMTNQTLQLIFGADPITLNSSGTMSQLEKRLTMSKTSEASKAADREMLKRRKSKRNKQNHFLTIDGEDI